MKPLFILSTVLMVVVAAFALSNINDIAKNIERYTRSTVVADSPEQIDAVVMARVLTYARTACLLALVQGFIAVVYVCRKTRSTAEGHNSVPS